MSTSWRVDVPDEAAMRALGERVGRAVGPGDVVALVGDLGMGKTVFTQGLALGLALPPGAPVTSPTFTLVNEHEGGRVPLVHADLYRLEAPREMAQVGLLDRYGGHEVVVVEWADRFAELLPPDRLHVRIVPGGQPGARIVELDALGNAARLASVLQGHDVRHQGAPAR